MKMIVVNIDDAISSDLSEELIGANYRVTHLAATGGFLRGGSTTLMIGVQDHFLQDALNLVRNKIKNHPNYEKECTTIYVLKVKNFNQFYS